MNLTIVIVDPVLYNNIMLKHLAILLNLITKAQPMVYCAVKLVFGVSSKLIC